MNTKLIVVISILILFLTLSPVSASENSTELDSVDGFEVLKDADDGNVSKTNTQIIPQDITGEEGDSVYVSFEIVDENENPVMNGTATLQMGDRNYSGDVINGSVLFQAVLIEKGIDRATVYYHGNEYYNDSQIDVDVYLVEESYFNIPIFDFEPIIGSAIFEEPLISQDSIGAVKAVSDSRTAGNPIFLVILSFMIISLSGIVTRRR